MRTEAEIRAAISTLERAVCSLAFPPSSQMLMAASVGALRYVLCDENTATKFDTLLGSIRETFAKIAAQPGNEA